MDVVSAVPAPVRGASASSPRLVLFVVACGAFLASLDVFIVNIAFPTIGAALHPRSPAALSWILNGYTIGFAALLAPAGRIADRIGRRRVFLTGMAIFVTTSAGAACAWGVWPLIGFRVVQSIGAAMMTATSLALLLHTFPPARRAHAIGVWSAVGAGAATLGPPLGGLLVQSSWRWIFLVNLPVGLLALLLGRRALPESRDDGEHRLPDVTGTGLLAVGVGAIAYAFVTAPEAGWAGPTTVATLTAGAGLLVAMVIRAARTPARLVPVLPLGLFRSRTFAAACLAALVFLTAFGAGMLGNVLFLTEHWRLSPARAGLYLLVGPVLSALFAVPAGRLGQRLGAGRVATAGTTLYGLGCLYWFARAGTTGQYLLDFLPGQLIAGSGVALTMTNLAAAASSTLPRPAYATGAATLNAARQIGTTLGVALVLAIAGGARGFAGVGPFRHAWLFMAATAGVAVVTTLFIPPPPPP